MVTRLGFFIVLLFAFVGSVCAQLPKPFKEAPPVLFRHEAYGSVIIHSEGWGIGYRTGKHKTGYLKRMYEIDLVGMRHPKEYNTSSGYENGQSYVYGKLNDFVVLRTGMGYQKVVFDKAERGGVQVRFDYFGGLSLGFLKPVYFEVYDTLNYPTIINTIRFDVNYPPELYYGKAPYLTGTNGIQIRPGIYTKMGLSFEYGREDTDVKTLEAGVCLDALSLIHI